MTTPHALSAPHLASERCAHARIRARRPARRTGAARFVSLLLGAALLLPGCRRDEPAAATEGTSTETTAEAPEGTAGTDADGTDADDAATAAARLEADDAMEPRAVLEALGATVVAGERLDYARMQRTRDEVLTLQARTTLDVQRAVRAARRAGMGVRTRGRGHSMNGHTLATADELLIQTSLMRSVCRASDETVRIGAGVSVVHADRFLARYGLRLRVRNDGPPGPSVGGYISAGGFGGASPTWGGLWSQVQRVELVDGTGEQRTLTPEDEDFAWLFGSVGQLGVIVGAELNVGPTAEDHGRPFPVGTCHEVALTDGEQSEGYAPIHYWWTLMVPDTRLEAAEAQLAAIRAGYEDRLPWLPLYRYAIPHRGIHAPLVTDVADDVTATGIWVIVELEDLEALQPLIQEVEQAVSELAQREGYRRYLSAELTTGPDAWRANLGEETWSRFRALKARLDPDALFGRGLVFPYGTGDDTRPEGDAPAGTR